MARACSPTAGIEETAASGAALAIHTLIADELLTCGNWHIAEYDPRKLSARAGGPGGGIRAHGGAQSGRWVTAANAAGRFRLGTP